MVPCPHCGVVVSRTARVCPNCGKDPSDVPPASVDAAERRLLTVVVPDLIGSTKLAQTLDPEDWHALLQAFQNECGEVIRRWGGHVAQHLGDGLLVYFGYPNAGEDDARRAVGAALEITRVVPRLRTPKGIAPLGVRVGVHTGVTVVGAIGSGQRRENLAVGGVPNVAAHLQKLAQPNGVVVADSTRRQVQGYYHCEPLDQGSAADGPVYRVVSATGAARSIDAAATVGLTEFTGRSHELALLQEMWARAVDGTSGKVLVHGEPGIGKSRLVHELKTRVTIGPAHVFEWHCSSAAQGTALRPVAEAVARRLGIADDDSPDERLQKLERGLAGFGVLSDDNMWLLGLLLSIPIKYHFRGSETSPQTMRKRTLEILFDILKILSTQQCVLLVVEDLQWADPSTLELIDLTMERLSSDRVLLVLTSRPEFHAPWRTVPGMTELKLARLSMADAERIVRQVAGHRGLPDEVLEELPPRSEGVPLFIEELTRAVIESGVLADRGDHYELVGPLEGDAIPSSIQASLAARIQRLGPSKRVAQVASVLGRTFSYELIRAVDGASDADLQRDLAELVKADMLHVTGEPPDATWTFKHALVRDAAYDSVLRKARRQLHDRIASVLVERFSKTAESHPELVAHHFTQGGNPGRAVPHWIEAGRQALDRSANHEALACLTKGLAAVAELDADEQRTGAELTMRVMVGPALMAVRGFSHSDVASNYTRAHELVGRVGDSPQMFDVLWGLWAQYFVGGQLLAARGPAEQVVRMARMSGDPGLVPPAHNALGYVECYTAHYAETVRLVEEGLAQFDFDRERDNLRKYQFSSSLALFNMGATALWMMGMPDQAREMAARSKPLIERLNHPPSSAYAISASSWFLQLAGDAKQVKQVVEIVSGLSEDEGFALWPPLVSVFGGWARMAEGDIEGGADTMLTGLRRYAGIGGGILRTHAFSLLAEGQLQAGRIQDALSTIDEAVANAHASGEVHFEPELHRIKGLALLTLAEAKGGPVEEALRSLERAIELAREQKARWLELRAATSLSRVLHARKMTARALELLAPVHASIVEGLDTREMKDAAALLDELRRG